MVDPARPITVIKIGGSVLTDRAAYRRLAGVAAEATCGGRVPVVAVVSAENGHTDRLLAEAREATGDREPDPSALALLWSTGEVRSVALLTIALRAFGIPAIGLDVHETGLRVSHDRPSPDHLHCNPLPIHAALTTAPVVVVPGFLVTDRHRIVTLGRGGSDWSAVRLAAGLGAARCVLIKDVDGYFTADPRTDTGARPIAALSYDDAIRMAADGCPLVQRQALEAAATAGLDLIVRSTTSAGTYVTTN